MEDRHYHTVIYGSGQAAITAARRELHKGTVLILDPESTVEPRLVNGLGISVLPKSPIASIRVHTGTANDTQDVVPGGPAPQANGNGMIIHSVVTVHGQRITLDFFMDLTFAFARNRKARRAARAAIGR